MNSLSLPRIKSTDRINDRILRQALLSILDYENLHPCSRIIEELGLRNGSVRIDVAVITSLLHGYEIKSNRRFNSQVQL